MPVPNTELPPGPDTSTPGPLTIALGERTVSGWIPCYRARVIGAKERWTGGAGTDYYDSSIEFSDDGLTIIASEPFAIYGIAADKVRQVDYGSAALTRYQIPWPLACPFRYARLVATGNNGGAAAQNVQLHGYAQIDGRDLVKIERTTVLAHATRAAGSYLSNWLPIARLMGWCTLMFFDDAARHTSFSLANLSDDESSLWSGLIFANALGLASGYTDVVFDDLAVNLVAHQHRLATPDRSGHNVVPFDFLQVGVLLNGTQTGQVDIITFSEP